MKHIDKHRRLGKVVDAEIARELGVAKSSVARARYRLGIPARCEEKTGKYVWTSDHEAMLGRITDRDLAERLGISRAAVQQARTRRGIAPAARQGERKNVIYSAPAPARLAALRESGGWAGKVELSPEAWAALQDRLRGRSISRALDALLTGGG